MTMERLRLDEDKLKQTRKEVRVPGREAELSLQELYLTTVLSEDKASSSWRQNAMRCLKPADRGRTGHKRSRSTAIGPLSHDNESKTLECSS